VLDALLPRTCAACRIPLSSRPEDPVGLCEDCRAGVVLSPSDACPVCGVPPPGAARAAGERCPRCTARSPAFLRLKAVFVYGETARTLILRFKHGKAFSLARPLGTMMAAVAARDGLLDGIDLVVPVPAWPARAVARRYSPPARLAAEVARRTGLPCDARVLARIRAPSDAANAGPRQRADQVRGAFAVRRVEAVRGRGILLVDDVVTTGATASEVAAVLRASGAARVAVLAAAIALPDAV
jgi:ComF family protein